MAITNIESTGFNSLFSASSRLAKRTIDANTTNQNERNLKTNNRSLTRENTTLKSQNKLLTRENEVLSSDNKSLSQQVNQSQAEKSQKLYENSTKQATYLEEFSTPSKNIDTSAPVANANTAEQHTEISSTSSYTSNYKSTDTVELGHSFNSFI
jgi:hypothetical protein